MTALDEPKAPRQTTPSRLLSGPRNDSDAALGRCVCPSIGMGHADQGLECLHRIFVGALGHADPRALPPSDTEADIARSKASSTVLRQGAGTPAWSESLTSTSALVTRPTTRQRLTI